MKRRYLAAILIFLSFASAFFIATSIGSTSATVKSLAALLQDGSAEGSPKGEILKLNDEVQEHKDKIQKINQRIEEYQQKIEGKRKESVSLQNQLSIIENRIAKTELEVEETEENIEATSLEVRALDLQIEEKQNLIRNEKIQLSEGIRRIDRADQRNRLEMLLLNDSFSEFFQEVAELEEVYSNLGGSIDRLQNLQSELKNRREDVEGKRLSLQKLKTKLEDIKDTLRENLDGKEELLVETKFTAQRFQGMVSDLRAEQIQIDDELAKLEGALRERLKNSDLALSPDQVILSWPVDPSRGITTYFHDPDYPFRYIFEHPALDIRASQGTPVRAAAAGYAARVRNAGMGYSYILLVHGGNISTLYGHLSGFNVAADSFVERGAVIGFSGGKPGTPGAGPLTTGAHLHFEVRSDGVPVDPLKFLIR